jgi:DNA-binding NtrC family response regulator
MAVTGADSVECAERLLGVRDYSVLVASADLPGNRDLSFLRRVSSAYPQLGLVAIAEPSTTEPAIAAVGMPVTAYLIKPFTADQFCRAVLEAAEQSSMAVEVMRLCREMMSGKQASGEGADASAGAAASALPQLISGVQRLVRSRASNPAQLCSSGIGTEMLERVRDLVGDATQKPDHVKQDAN